MKLEHLVIKCGILGCLLVARTQAEPESTSLLTLKDAHEQFISGQYEQAIRSYEALVARVESNGEPQYPQAVGDLTWFEAKLGLAQCELMIGKYNEGIARLTVLNTGLSGEWHYLLAQFQLRVGKYDEAISHLKSAIAANGDFAGPRRLLGETQELLGRRDEAIDTYRWFDQQIAGRPDLPKNAEWITDAAIGFLRYTVLTNTDAARRTKHVLNEMLQQVYGRLDRGYWPARIDAANLLREKHNNDEHDGSVSDYEAALKINPQLPEAQVGLGEVALENWGFEEIEKRVAAALTVNSNFAPAMRLQAEKFILERRYAQAMEVCDRVLTINPNDLSAMSLKAAAAACRFDDQSVEELRSRVAALNPKCALFHRTVADALSGIRQYEASEKEYRTAIELEPSDANARTQLGMMYMQWGIEDKAREALTGAWALDPYNESTKFTLDLLDRLQHFDRFESPHFTVRYDAKHDPGLGEIAAGYLEPIYAEVTSDYETPIEEKTIIEFFPTHKAFGVRITGKPWIHTVGACTGRVIALSSPRDEPELMGRYDISRVLHHEFTHTVTLKATNNRIPHWFTEGLAVYQENSPRPFEWMGLLANAIRRNELFTLTSIDWGFIRPKRPTDRQMAYAQSEWMCEYINQRWGFDAIQAMLKRYREGQTQPRVVREQLGIEMDQFDTDFAAWAKQQTIAWAFDLSPLENPEELRTLAQKESSAAVFGRLSRAEFEADREGPALDAAKKALELDPHDRNALEVIVTFLKSKADEARDESDARQVDDEANAYVERLTKVDPKSWTAWKFAGDIAMRRKNWDRAEEAWKNLQRLCPMDPASWQGLAGIYLEKHDDNAALTQLLELANMEQHDPSISRQVGSIMRRKGNLKESEHWYKRALGIDPFDAELHRSLGEVQMQQNNAVSAMQEYRMLTVLQPKDVHGFEAAALAALKAGDKDKAADFARTAVKLDANTSVRSLAHD